MFEAHPVPQNVTEFEFHLVGDMTIKQFVYLASGIGAAYLTFALFSNSLPFLAYPLILIFSASGAALAFLPIQERPLDHWLGAYFRAIFQPTKRTYKSKLITKEDPLFKTRLQVYLNSKRSPIDVIPNNKTKSTPFSFSMTSIHQKDGQGAPAPTIIAGTPPLSNAAAPLPAGPKQAFTFAKDAPSLVQPVQQPQTTVLGSASLASVAIPQEPLPYAPAPVSPPNPKPAPTPAVVAPIAPAPQPVPQVQPASLPPKPPAVQQPPRSASEQQTQMNAAKNAPPSEDELNKTIAIAKQVHEVQQNIMRTEEQIDLIRSKAATQDANPKDYLSQFHQLLSDLQVLQDKAAALSQEVAVLTKEPLKPPTDQPEVAVKPKSIPTITLTSIENVINGIVTDNTGNYLDGAIILAHDKQGIPVRALKTNKLGQFVAATPLNNGIYTITIEKDELVFDTIEIELIGTILKPILITAKPVAAGVAHG